MDFFIRTAQLLLALSILVLVHELGHFGFARIFKVRVEKFYLFFNPWFTLFKIKSKRSGTEYGLGWLPLGGYCKIAGMVDESMDKQALNAPPQPWEYRTQKNWKKLFIISGGVLMNFIFAMLIYSAILFVWGKEITPLSSFEKGFTYNQTAQTAGFQNGDKIVAINKERCENEDIGNVLLRLSVEKVKSVTVLRNDRETEIFLPDDFIYKSFQEGAIVAEPIISVIIDSVISATSTLQAGDQIISIAGENVLNSKTVISNLKKVESNSIELEILRHNVVQNITAPVNEEKKLGIIFQPVSVSIPSTSISYTVFSCIPAGIQEGYHKLVFYVKQMRFLFTKKGASSIGGFGTIGKLFSVQWDWLNFWNMTAFLSVILAFMNILPIPALDGGHLIFILVEMVSGRKLSDKFMETMQTIGFILLIMILLYANFSDIFRALFN